MLNSRPAMLASLLLLSLGITACVPKTPVAVEPDQQAQIEKLVADHAKAWKTGDVELLDSLLHEDVVFAYPGRRLNKEQTIEDLIYFKDHFIDTEVYVNKIIVAGNDVAVEWQFATTEAETGERQVVSDGIIGEIKDGQILVWKEYLDGRVKLKQADGELEYEEGEEPFPWPKKIGTE